MMLRVVILLMLVQRSVTDNSIEDTSVTSAPHQDTEHAEAQIFMKKIFSKYGKNGALTYEGFEHLLISLGIGNLKIHDHDIHDHFKQGEFIPLHTDHQHAAENMTVQDNATDPVTYWPENNQPGDEQGRSRSKRAPADGGSQRDYGTESDIHVKKNCMTAPEILQTFEIPSDHPITQNNFLHLCPAIVYQIDKHSCASVPCDDIHDDIHRHIEAYHLDHNNQSVSKHPVKFWQIPAKTWGFAILAVTIISLVGLVCVAIIPVIQLLFFNHLIQFLVALAIGSLTGDALLHLIPHSMVPHTDTSHSHTEDESNHRIAVYKGLIILTGVYSFFLAERGLRFLSAYREKKRINKKRELVSDQSDYSVRYSMYRGAEVDIGEKLSRHNRVSMYDVLNTAHPQQGEQQLEQEELHMLQSCDDHVTNDTGTDVKDNHKLTEIEYEPEQKGHGHSHSHEAPSSVSAIAWMVIMGDGLHNFCDGMAIGAAFASSITGGLSTSVAVFCHELPHELGDFAVLLRTGMSAKQALFYNLVSSVLCFLGVVIGLLAGNLESADSWIFGLAAGMFIYISLVDMLPEISSHSVAEDSHSCCYLLLHCLGISCGVSIMLVIALYEDQISLGIGDDAL